MDDLENYQHFHKIFIRLLISIYVQVWVVYKQTGMEINFDKLNKKFVNCAGIHFNNLIILHPFGSALPVFWNGNSET